ncbi:MAG: hypothetical protein IIU28_00365 [Lachnospiraceae bacterium]|nr:hypothetical protein [Lachnospiraceae bacterium]
MEQRFAGEIGKVEEARFPRRSSGMAICGGMALFMQQSPGSRESHRRHAES